MKDQIFQKLKTAYSQLGLGDNLLLAQANTLASTGLVTAENIDAVVTAQKELLEGFQKSNDKRVTDALSKAKTEAEQELAKAKAEAEKVLGEAKAETSEKVKQLEDIKARFDTLVKETEERAKRAAEEQEKRKQQKGEADTTNKQAEAEAKNNANDKTADSIPAWYRAIMEAEKAKAEAEEQTRQLAVEAQKAKAEADALKQTEEKTLLEKRLQEIIESNQKLTEGITALQQKNEAYEKEREAVRREGYINQKIKELGIPEWRVNEGFNIASDASDEAISEYLGKVAGNIKSMSLPTQKTAVPISDDGKVSQEIANSLAASIVNKM